ncbi:hypothetical protein E2C01_043146 [Portunus trituberculatus]|uniref:Cadherin domain-containing protein n=1 Tax=Portunus trituberculatus TaxID=210409 RepID=A0A5B7FVB8_PORTR|nr:hypothetical protein [Portunus trituberculatus]
MQNTSASPLTDVAIRFSITGGNRDGLFTIDQRSGLISLAAQLDYERQPKEPQDCELSVLLLKLSLPVSSDA